MGLNVHNKNEALAEHVPISNNTHGTWIFPQNGDNTHDQNKIT